MPERAKQTAGFTLIEVLVATLALGLVISAVSALVGQTLAAMSETRAEQQVTRLAEQKMREILATAEGGELPRIGVEEGVFDRTASDEIGHAYRMEVEPFSVPVPAGIPAEKLQGSGLFSQATRSGDSSGSGPAVRRVLLRVYREDGTPEGAQPFALLLAESGETPTGPGTAPGQITPRPGESLGDLGRRIRALTGEPSGEPAR